MKEFFAIPGMSELFISLSLALLFTGLIILIVAQKVKLKETTEDLKKLRQERLELERDQKFQRNVFNEYLWNNVKPLSRTLIDAVNQTKRDGRRKGFPKTQAIEFLNAVLILCAYPGSNFNEKNSLLQQVAGWFTTQNVSVKEGDTSQENKFKFSWYLDHTYISVSITWSGVNLPISLAMDLKK